MSLHNLHRMCNQVETSIVDVVQGTFVGGVSRPLASVQRQGNHLLLMIFGIALFVVVILLFVYDGI